MDFVTDASAQVTLYTYRPIPLGLHGLFWRKTTRFQSAKAITTDGQIHGTSKLIKINLLYVLLCLLSSEDGVD